MILFQNLKIILVSGIVKVATQISGNTTYIGHYWSKIKNATWYQQTLHIYIIIMEDLSDIPIKYQCSQFGPIFRTLVRIWTICQISA